METGPCCTDTGDGTVVYIDIAGKTIGIVDLDWIVHSVRKMELSEDGQIKEELIQKVMSKNYVPSSAREKYAKALLKYYRDYTGK